MYKVTATSDIINKEGLVDYIVGKKALIPTPSYLRIKGKPVVWETRQPPFHNVLITKYVWSIFCRS